MLAALSRLAVVALSLGACAPGPTERWDTTTREGVAVGGYDAVAYFADQAAVEGDPALTLEWEGVTWWFGSEDNRDAFEREPERYAPSYGGWCAWSMRWNQVIDSNPEQWRVDGQRLYLFNNADARDSWGRNPERFRRIADDNWAAIEQLP
ncbi:MAG: YHS domain protein [Deltaproteobacteria bacterium]|nr:YHS domain protein [Deltaproteobacteria bacterium]